MERSKLYLSTIAPEAHALAGTYGLGLEIAESCTAAYMERPETDSLIREKLSGIKNRVLHGPFNELFPCAIDPRARALAKERYLEAMEYARAYGANKVILHSGYLPNVYYDCWFEEQSILFWKDFVQTIPRGMTVCLENVLETAPEPLMHIMEAVNDDRLRICLDIGHANCYSHRPAGEWICLLGPWISHFHIHNNHGQKDTHNHLTDGTMDMAALLVQTEEQCPEATVTLEIPEPEQDVLWLLKEDE